MKRWMCGFMVLLVLFLSPVGGWGADPLTIPYRSWAEVLASFTPLGAEQCSNNHVVVLAQSPQGWLAVAIGPEKAMIPTLVVMGPDNTDYSFILRPGASKDAPWSYTLGPIKDAEFFAPSLCQLMENVEKIVKGHQI